MNATQRARFSDQATLLNREIDAINLAAVGGKKPKAAKKIAGAAAARVGQAKVAA